MNAPILQRTRPISIALLAMGGEGGGVLADWIIDLAEHNRHIAQLTSIPGVAQRTGATIYYLELYPEAAMADSGREPVLGLMPMPGDVDVVIASELMEAGRAIQRGLVTPDRTTLIASNNRVFAMTEKMALADGRVDEAALMQACRSAAGRLVAFDMAAIAEATGSVISAVLFGALAGAGVLPFPRQAFEASIRRSGVGVAASLAAFTAGYEAAVAGGQPAAAVAEPVAAVAGTAPAGAPAVLARLFATVDGSMPEPVRGLIRIGAQRTADYQDLAYARRYLDRLGPVLDADRLHGDGSWRLLRETARVLALGMAYEDTIRVAELKIRPSRFARVRREVKVKDGQLLEIAEFMHPRVEEIADTLPAPIGRWILRTGWARRAIGRLTHKGKTIKTSSIRGFLLLYAVASLKPLRPRSLRYETEQRELESWLQTLIGTAGTNYELAVEVAAARALVRGYGDTHERGRARYRQLVDMLPDLHRRDDAAAQLAALRKAANADESGAALDKAIAALPPLQPA